MDLSVIIVNWNTKDLLQACLYSIFKFTKNLNFEVIVVDNNSSDGSQQMVKTKYPQVNIILNIDNLGFGKANNQGVKTAGGKYILFLNSDTYLIENSFAKLVKEAENLQNRGSTPKGVGPLKLGAMGPMLLNEDRTIQQSVGFFPHLPQIFFWMSFLDDLPLGTVVKPYHVDHDSFYRKEHEVDWLTGAALLVPRKILNKIGLFDEKIFMYGEDVDLCKRIKDNDLKVIFTPITQVVHLRGGSTNRISTQAFIGEYQGLKYLYKKYKGKLALQILRFLLKIGALTRIVVFTLLGRKELAKSYAQVFKVA